MKFRILTLLIICSLYGQQIIAQDRRPPPPPQSRDFWDKFYVGGSMGLQFGTITVIDLAPQFGYRVTERFITGVGITYVYYKNTDPHYYPNTASSMYGGSIFSRFLVYNNFFVHAELEALNLEVYTPVGYSNNSYNYNYEITRRWVPDLFVGGGYRQPMGERSFLSFLLLYEVIQDRFSPYYNTNPIIRIGFGMGF